MFHSLMPRSYKALRLAPPWPPGLESLKKSFLGSRRHRVLPMAGSEWAMYNDTLPIALALSSFLKDSAPFEMRVSGLEFTAALQLPVGADMQAGKALLRALINQRPFLVAQLQACAQWQVQITGLVEGIHFNHISPMTKYHKPDGRGKINMSWEMAFRTLQLSNCLSNT